VLDMSDIATRIASSSVVQLQAQKLVKQVPKIQDGDRAKIEKAAADFESILLAQWLEEAQQAFASAPGSDPDENQDADPGHGQFQSLAIQSLARSLTKSGGIGIAKMIVRQLEDAQNKTEDSAVTGPLHRLTPNGMSGSSNPGK